MPLLAQGIRTIPDLPGPPIWDRLLFEQPILGAAVVLGAVVIGAIALNQSGRGRLALGVGGLGVVLAAGVALAGVLIETPREHMRVQVNAFVDAVAAGDAQRAGELLSERLVLASDGAQVPGRGKDSIVTLVPWAGHRVASHSVKHKGVEMLSDAGALTRFSVTARDERGASVPTVWDLNWTRSTDGVWRIVTIDLRSMYNQQPSANWVTGVRP